MRAREIIDYNDYYDDFWPRRLFLFKANVNKISYCITYTMCVLPDGGGARPVTNSIIFGQRSPARYVQTRLLLWLCRNQREFYDQKKIKVARPRRDDLYIYRSRCREASDTVQTSRKNIASVCFSCCAYVLNGDNCLSGQKRVVIISFF